MKKQKPVWAVIYGLILVAYTAYVMLDMFVIQRPMQDASDKNLSLFLTPSPSITPTEPEKPTPTEKVEPKPTDVTVPSEAPTEKPTETPTPTPTNTPTPTPEPTPTSAYFTDTPVSTETTYSNDHLYVKISEYYEHHTKIHVAEVRVTSAQYLLTAFAKNTYGRNINQKPTEMSAANGAILAIDGDNYGAREGGYVLRNGILYREKGDTSKQGDVLCIMPNGDFEFTHANKNVTAKQLRDKGCWQVLTFGPTMIDNGKILVDVNYEVPLCYVSNPRTAIGMVEPLHYFIVVSDGRTAESWGLSIYQVADFMKRLGCVKAYNLDGGGSSTMVFQGKIINFPTSEGTFYERGVSDIVYFK